MSYAVRKDGKGWRAVSDINDVMEHEDYSEKQPELIYSEIPEYIDPLNGLIVLHQFGFSDAYSAWAYSPERTFTERAFIEKAKVWRRNDSVLLSGAEAIGITEKQLDDLFKAASIL